MPMTFSVRVKKTGILAKSAGVTQRTFNGCVKRALQAIGMYWLAHFLKKHFDPRAYLRYRYAARSWRTKRLKEAARQTGQIKRAEVRGGRTVGSQVFPTPPDVGPLVWAGELKRELMSRPPNQFGNPDRWATATAKKQRVKVPVKFPHPMRAVNAAEVTVLIPEEVRELHKVGQIALVNELNQLGLQVRTSHKIAHNMLPVAA
jgi:hypothetical protein